MSAMIEVENISLAFDRTQILRDLNLEVVEGERHAVIGPNGAGKSSLFNVISGLYPVQTGQVRLRGETISGLPSNLIARRGLSRSFQVSAIFASMSVFENVRMAAMSFRPMFLSLFLPVRRLEALNARTAEIIELVGLQRVADKPAGDLTYSEQRALEVGMTLAPDPSVILLDEPTSGMSGDESQRFVELLHNVTVGKTLLVVEHDMEVVFSLCNRVSVLVGGSVIATGAPEDIRANARVQEAYLGVETDQTDEVA